MSSDDDFLSRWSRLKRTDVSEYPAPEPSDAPVVEEVQSSEPSVPETEEQALERLGLPDPDSLEEGDDFTGFLKSGVPDALRRRALRRLWRSNPVLANVDGLVDYGEDFTDAAMVPDVLATAYKVGQGMIKKIVEGEDAVDGDGADMPDIADTEPDDATSVETVEDVTGEVTEDEDALQADPGVSLRTEQVTADDIEDAAPTKPRRMRFSNT